MFQILKKILKTIVLADSGGSFAKKYDSNWKILGIVSFTIAKSCDEPHVVAFTNVVKYLDWIKLYL